MDGKVIFGKDGVLRFRSYVDESKAIPLVLIQEAQEANPYSFFLQQMRKTFILEDGSTIASFALCLEPWANVVSDITDRNFQSYIDEIRKPSAELPVFNRCEVRKQLSFSRELYHEPLPEGVNWLTWLNRTRETVWLDSYQLTHDYNICGYTDGDPSNYSMSCSIHELKNVPLVINRQPVIFTSIRAEHAPALLNVSAAGVSVQERDEPKFSTLVAKGATDEDMTVLDLIQVVVEDGLWFNTPQGAINLNALLADQIEHLDLDEPEGLEEVPVGELEDEEDEEKRLTIKVAPGAFDGITAHYNREQEEWDELVAKMQPTGRLSYRIGEITEATPTDDRGFGMIFK